MPVAAGGVPGASGAGSRADGATALRRVGRRRGNRRPGDGRTRAGPWSDVERLPPVRQRHQTNCHGRERDRPAGDGLARRRYQRERRRADPASPDGGGADIAGKAHAAGSRDGPHRGRCRGLECHRGPAVGRGRWWPATSHPPGGTRLFDAVWAALQMINVPPSSTPQRAMLVVFSDGRDTTSWFDADVARAQLDRSQAVVFAVSVPPLQLDPASASEWSRAARLPDLKFLRSLTDAGGGRLFL